MFLKKTPKPKGTYLAITESYYDKEKKTTRQKTIMPLGYLEELKKEYPDPVAHFEQVVADMNQERETRKNSVVVLFFIGNPVLHGSPEIHGNGTQLNLYRIVFAGIQAAHIYPKDKMVAAVSVWFGIFDVISFPDKNKVWLFLQHIHQIIYIAYKITDNPDSGNILQLVFGIFISWFKTVKFQFFLKAVFLLDPVLYVMARLPGLSLINGMIQHFDS